MGFFVLEKFKNILDKISVGGGKIEMLFCGLLNPHFAKT